MEKAVASHAQQLQLILAGASMGNEADAMRVSLAPTLVTNVEAPRKA